MSPEARAKLATMTEDERALLRPLVETSRTYYVVASFLGFIVLWGIFAYYLQVRHGLGRTGLNRPEYWGIYIICFVFFIGISHAGTLISAILRVSKAEWRRSITRSAELITVLVIGFGAIQPIVDLGRPDRALNIIFNAQLGSPLLWDVISIGLYFTACTIYLYVPMLPDLARIRDLEIKAPRFYRLLAAGYQHTPSQRATLERVIGILSIVVIPIAISVHTVIGWIFAMTLRPMWHSTIFGPYFVMGAIYSGIAAILVAMVILRRVYHLEDYFKPVHFDYLGRLLLVFSLLWFYFTFAEYLTVFYGAEPAEMRTFWAKVTGPFALPFWTMVMGCFFVPLFLMARRSTRTPKGTMIAGIAVLIGMWLERFNIVVPTSVNPIWELESLGRYLPSWIEVSIMSATFAGFVLLYMIATKFVPIVSIWEMEEGRKESVISTSERVWTYLPQPKGAEQILRILGHLATVDLEVQEQEIELIRGFARKWNIPAPDLTPGAVTGESSLPKLREAVQAYLEYEPSPNQASQLLEVLKMLVRADEEVAREEERVLLEITTLIHEYLETAPSGAAA
jgi:molybdopterin-containing oxidoreductase family membrane subunit